MKKAERILDLIALLLNTKQPLSFEEIQHAFPDDYGEGDEEAIARKFERDKADILELGLPLRFERNDENEAGGYRIDRSSYGLPELLLEPEELALLSLAGSAALALDGTPFHQDLLLALNKLSWSSDQPDSRLPRPLPGIFQASQQLPDALAIRRKERLETLNQAIATRKTVLLFYHGLWSDQKTRRNVDPYGLVCQRGVWFLVGHCHLRQAVRVFHVDRISALEINRFKPKTPDFEAPADMRILDHVPPNAWSMHVHDPVEVRIRFLPPVARWMANELGTAGVRVSWEEETCLVEMSVTCIDGLLPLVLSLRDKAQILGPEELIAKTVAALERIAGT